jgi:ketosteroid isomerase-like protein
MRRLFLLVALGAGVAAAGDRSSELLAVVESERAFAARAQVVDARQAFAEFFAPDAILFSPFAKPAFPELNEPVAWKTNIQWRPAAAAVSGAGDMGYTTGPAEYRKTPADAPHGWSHYTSVWGRQSDGKYKVLIDIGIPHPEPKLRIADWTPPAMPPAAVPRQTKLQLARASMELQHINLALGQVAQGDLAGAFASVLVPEGRVHRPGMLPAVGRSAAVAALRQVSGSFGWTETTGLRIAASGDFGFTYGRGTFAGAAQGPASGDINYLNIWQRRQGEWRLLVHVSHPVRLPPK